MKEKVWLNRPFPSYLVPLFQNESSCKTFHMKMSLIFMEMNICRRKTLTCEWFQTKTCFDTEAKANPEMANSEFSYSETTDYQGWALMQIESSKFLHNFHFDTISVWRDTYFVLAPLMANKAEWQ